ncbi:MAG: cytochrome c biogenesis protein ResB, partial [Planctomycetaceae bacterium]|nr:cytochrome c biogenesis protein ResB [Planctomycetaceae bacterium]
RSYRPYSVTLLDVSRTNYVGSTMPRDYHSRIRINDPAAGGPQEFSPRMNSPLRYKGETFYQSSYIPLPNGKEATVLSVVDNRGWMLPYIGCMIVAVGMCSQFWQTLSRFLKRVDETPPGTAEWNDADAGSDAAGPPQTGDAGDAPQTDPLAALRRPAMRAGQVAEHSTSSGGSGSYLLTTVFVLMFAAMMIGRAIPRKAEPDVMDIRAFGAIPVLSNGRSMPIDTFAQTQLLLAAGKSTFEGELEAADLDRNREKLIAQFDRYLANDDKQAAELQTFQGDYSAWIAEMCRLSGKSTSEVEAVMRSLMVAKMPATRWILDLATRPDVADRHRVLRITNDQILAALGLEQRAGLTYSLAEVEPQSSALSRIRESAAEKQANDQENSLTQTERRTGAMFSSMMQIRTMETVFGSVELDGDLLEVTERIWSHQNESRSRTAVRAVFTGAEEEERSALMAIEADSLMTWQAQCEAVGVRTPEQFADYCEKELPATVVKSDLAGFWKVLEEMSADSLGIAAAPEEDTVPRRAAIALGRIDDPYFRGVFALIAGAGEGETPTAIYERLDADIVQKLGQRKISSAVAEFMQKLVSSEKHSTKMDEIRTRLRSMMQAAEAAGNEDALMTAMSREFTILMFQEILDSHGDLLFDGKHAEQFATNHASFKRILTAWKDGDANEFNQAVADYQTSLNSQTLPHLDPGKVRLEAWFNQAEPLWQPIYPYLTAMLLCFLGWILYAFHRVRGLNTTIFAIMLLAFLVHTFGLYLRYRISGRPPVTNLYSSAIFIGWVIVLASFFAERFVKRGIGLLTDTVCGAAS